ncbi:helix-turn-helix transcriptional regulator [Shewanella pneumatophori]|uniref:WYL domain-containing protein n=1 Tax=Shewanella pneumatophori TaxID=314092 RepID=A0A9X1ZDT6_9GAMM|nr:WYL domain-containing protein [Shewanella pneumatophori]MCL1139182.1 WYL domain-containing protein [Shewanella pneumatophori]
MQANIQRQLVMLELIPTAPRRVTANMLTDMLHNRGYEVGLRTVQRELKAMYDMGLFGLALDERCKPFGWSIAACWRGLNLTLMDQHMALGLHILKRNAQQLLPPESIEQLTPYFERADQVLANDPNNPWLYWACRVAQLPEPYPFTYVESDPETLKTVQYALLHKRQIACQIERVIKGKRYWIDYQPVNPEGIKISDGVALLAFTVGTTHVTRYAKPINLLRNVRLLDSAAITRDDFDIGRSAQASEGALIDIELLFTPSASFILRGVRLSDNQTIEQVTDGRYLVKATVKDTPKLRTWLWNINDKVEVMAPIKLRSYFIGLIHKMNTRYQNAATDLVAPVS